MLRHGPTRRAFVGSFAAIGLSAPNNGCAPSNGWAELFNGRNLDGWRPSDNKDSWKVIDGRLTAGGPMSHLFYSGPVRGAEFRNFELEVEALARPLGNSGIYFHTAYQESSYPRKGLRVQISNASVGKGSGNGWYKTGSLCSLRGIYKQFVPDDQWFKMRILVQGKNIQVRVNGTLLVDYTEPTPPVLPSGIEGDRYLTRGTFALQCEDEKSRVQFRSVRVRPLRDDISTPGPAPVVDDVFKKIISLTAQGFPVVDYHVHVRDMNVEEVLAQSRRDGIQYGIAVNCGLTFPTQDDDAAVGFVDGMKGLPVFVAMQAEGREWTRMFTKRSAALFDYIFTDSMTWTDDSGKRMQTWLAKDVGTIANPQAFMEMLIGRILGIMEREPIDIYVNPAYLPEVIAKDCDRLWTAERMKRVADAAARNQVAIELNDSRSLPGPAFVRVAKKAGCKFTFGTNNVVSEGLPLRRSDYALRMIDECALVPQDFWVPGAYWPRALERKPDVLRA